MLIAIIIVLLSVIVFLLRRGPATPTNDVGNQTDIIVTTYDMSSQASPSTSAVASQAQTTYTAVRGNICPRFLPLPAGAHG